MLTLIFPGWMLMVGERYNGPGQRLRATDHRFARPAQSRSSRRRNGSATALSFCSLQNHHRAAVRVTNRENKSIRRPVSGKGGGLNSGRLRIQMCAPASLDFAAAIIDAADIVEPPGPSARNKRIERSNGRRPKHERRHIGGDERAISGKLHNAGPPLHRRQPTTYHGLVI